MALVDEPHEILYRAILPDESMWDKEFNRPSPATFIDKKGLSVVKRGKRTEKETISALKKKIKSTKAIAKISVNACLDIITYPIDKPTSKDSYHAELWNSKIEKLIDYSKRKLLAEKVEVLNFDF